MTKIPLYRHLPDNELPPYQLFKRWQTATGNLGDDIFYRFFGKIDRQQLLNDIAERKSSLEDILK